ncbi:MAG TPA: glycosyltransferase family 9 protein [Sphingomonas sp.]|nr:glycosyltransferase family 9 protein [Sphingomonas sp.]
MTISMQAWTAAMRGERYADAWAIEDRAAAARDPASADDPALPYHRRWVWDGRSLAGADVLVRCYHGLGDTIQFARYLPALAARARSVTLEVQPRLASLLAHLPVDRIVPFDVRHPTQWDGVAIEITELPRALRLAPDAAPPPYLASAPAIVPAGTIGVCHLAGDWDLDRSIPAELFRPLCTQYPALMLAPGATDLPCLNPEGCPFDLEATAALVAAVDLVVTVDTMIAHLAGAMGRPTWLLLKHEPDWRWSPSRQDTPWYPSLRLYAQPTPGDWPAVLVAVAADLATLAPRRSSAAWPA